MPEIDGAVIDDMVDDALSELFREVHAMRREQELRRILDEQPVRRSDARMPVFGDVDVPQTLHHDAIDIREDETGRLRLYEESTPAERLLLTPMPLISESTPTLVDRDRNLSVPVKIPNVYKKWRPQEYPSDYSHSADFPEGITGDTPVKVIYRGGMHSKGIAREYFWGDAPNDGVLIAYRVIKLPDSPHGAWVRWGIAHDNGITLDTTNGIPRGLSRSARVQVWLRDYDEPQSDIREAGHWDWTINSESGGDIMRYRVISSI